MRTQWFNHDIGYSFMKLECKNVQHSAVLADQDALADDLGAAADVLEHLLVDVGEGAVVRADGDTLALVGLAKHGALGNENNVVLVELLLELADEACFFCCNKLEIYKQNDILK